MNYYITVWKDKKIGTAEVSLDKLITVGFDSSAIVTLEIKNIAKKLVGTGELDVFMRYENLFIYYIFIAFPLSSSSTH